MSKLADNFMLLEKQGLTLCPYTVVFSSKSALRAADELGYPVVLKIGSDIHKKDIGGVITNIHNSFDMSEFWRKMQKSMKENNVSPVEFVVQQQISGVELVVGLKIDPVFGPVIMLGSGGTFVEILNDVVFRACPITLNDAEDMIKEIKSYRLLTGFRGEKPANIEALKDVLYKLSRLHRKLEFDSMDINPLIVNEKDAFVVDARIVKQ